MTRRTILVAAAAVLFGMAATAWWQRQTLLASWHARGLAQANDETREQHARALARTGPAAIEPILRSLRNADDAGGRNLEFGLRLAVADWLVDDPKSVLAMRAIRNRFDETNRTGQRTLLGVLAVWLGRDEESRVPTDLATSLVELAERSESVDELRPFALNLAGALVEHGAAEVERDRCRRLAIKGLSDSRPATRMAAIQIVLREPFRSDADLMRRVTPFLRDPDAAVRRVALIALGTNGELVTEEDLLPLLHDADAETQRLCEVVLRSRGLSDGHVHLARLISHDSAAVRLEVLPLLRQTKDLDPDVWLRRLTTDPAPAVRAAAIRVVAVAPSDDLRRRLVEMARLDPSATVREIARFYVDRATVRRAAVGTPTP